MQLTKQAISDIQEFKDWLLEDVQSNVCVMNLPKDEDIHLDLGEHLQESHWTTEERPCAKCEAGITHINVKYTARDITVKSGEEMAHMPYVFECDEISQSLWAMAWKRGLVVAKWKKLDMDGDGKWESESDVMGVFDVESDTYKPMKRAGE